MAAQATPARADYVSLQGVSCRFGEVIAVDQVDLDVRQGELFCLLGGSGCGKSTLLRLLAGFEDASAGSIRIDGVDMQGVPPHRRPVNMMFQSYALFPHMSVVNNVAFGLRQERLGNDEIRRRVAEMLALVQLADMEHRKPRQLSGGQQQRVALARCLIKRPKLLLLDEPLGALDKKLRESTQFELVNIQERLGVTFVVVTHDQQEAMSLATRIAVMRAGRIEQVGTPGEIYESPRNRYVADFIGSVNLFAGQVVSADAGQARIECETAGGTLSAATERRAVPGSKVCVAVRPEKIRLVNEAPPDAANTFPCKVEEIAYLGDLSVYLVRLAGGMQVRVTQPNLTRIRPARPSWDERAWIQWDPASGVVLHE